MRKVDRDLQRQLVGREGFIDRFPVLHAQRSRDPSHPHTARMFADAGTAQRLEKRPRAAIHDGWLRPVQRDEQVIDA